MRAMRTGVVHSVEFVAVAEDEDLRLEPDSLLRFGRRDLARLGLRVGELEDLARRRSVGWVGALGYLRLVACLGLDVWQGRSQSCKDPRARIGRHCSAAEFTEH